MMDESVEGIQGRESFKNVAEKVSGKIPDRTNETERDEP
jgi:hypothetical protein